jgi:molybdopterin molybdotransferase
MKQPDFLIGLSLRAARDRIVEVCAEKRLGGEQVALADALGRVLAQSFDAPFDLPPFANSAMDGFAVRAGDVPAAGEARLRIIGTRLAGDGTPIALQAGECLRLTTGAPMPPGADAVAIKENVRVEGDVAHVGAPVSAGAHVRYAGEDFRRGDSALPAGTVLTAGPMGVLAAFGETAVTVSRQPRVVLLTTGDELVVAGRPLEPGQIYDSNRISLGALLQDFGVASLRHEHVRDDPQALSDALSRAAQEADLVLSSGGVSAGEADFLPGLLHKLGKVHLWKVRIKPGMPLLFGEIDKALVCSLPGNPVSGMATFLALLRPGLDALIGRKPRQRTTARLAVAVSKSHGRAEYLRATAQFRDDGTLWVTPLPRQGSGMLHTVAQAACLVLIDEPVQTLEPGSVVEVLPLPGLC